MAGAAVERPHVAVVGPGQATAEVCALAEQVGRELARRGAVVVTGARLRRRRICAENLHAAGPPARASA